MTDYRIVVVDEILPKNTKLTVEKLRLIWASRVRCRRLCGYMFPACDHPITTANERLSVRTYCENAMLKISYCPAPFFDIFSMFAMP